MKSKLLLFLGLTVASLGLAITLDSPQAHAADERYVWTSATSVQASGGKYRGTTTFTVTQQRQFQGTTLELLTNDVNIDATYGDCDHAVGRLTFTDNNRTNASLWMGDLATGTVTSCGSFPASEQGMDEKVTIGAQATPEYDYATVNCETVSRTVDGLANCRAIKACVVTAKKPQAQCVSAMTTCTQNGTQNGAITDAALADCRKKITAGDIAGATGEDDAESENKTTCAVVGIGWILCPVLTFLSEIVDASYGFVASLLVVQPLVTTGTSGTAAIYNAWSVMRNFANISFVIAFLVIIFSQLTSIGLSNYGIKKMLPKLIVCAVLVNLSFWVCAAAVDVSNITGSSINTLFEGIKNGVIATPNVQVGDADTTGEGWAGIVGAILAGGAGVGIVLYIGLSALLPALIAVGVTIVVVFLVLTLRQALIILLIVISPLAFVARLLPNTQQLYDSWWKLFKILLVMYPSVSFIFGGSSLASAIIMLSATGEYKIAIQIAGAAVAVLPLVVVPAFIKSSSGVIGRFVGDPNKGPIDALKRGANNYRKDRQTLRDAKALNGGRRFGKTLVRRNARRQAVIGQHERNYNNAKANYIAKESISGEVSATQKALAVATRGNFGGETRGDQLLNKMGKGGGDSGKNAALAQAISVNAKIEAEEVTAAAAVIKHLNLDRNQQAMRDLSMGGKVAGLDGSNSAVRAAAMKGVVDSHDVAGVNQLLDNVKHMDERTRESFADSLMSSSQKPDYVGQSAISDIRQHDGINVTAKSSTQLAVEAINNNTYSVDKIATGDKDELAFIAAVAGNTANGTSNAQIKANAVVAQTDPRYSGKIGKNAGSVQSIASLP